MPDRAFLEDASAGTVGGVAGILVGSPFDVIKTAIQQRPSAPGAAPPPRLAAALRSLAGSAAGVRRLFAGSAVSCLAQAPVNFLTFGVYGGVRRAVEASTAAPGGASSPPLRATFAAGCAAGVAQALALAPFEHCKVQQQLAAWRSDGAPPGLAAVARDLAARGALFRGLAATLLRDAPTFGVYFASFELAREFWHEREQRASGAGAPAAARGEPPAWVTLLAGGLAGVLSWALALPADVIKSRVQGVAPSERTPRIAAVATALYAEAGLRGFFKGAVPCLIRAVPVNAVTFLVYTKSLRFIRPSEE